MKKCHFCDATQSPIWKPFGADHFLCFSCSEYYYSRIRLKGRNNDHSPFDNKEPSIQKSLNLEKQQQYYCSRCKIVVPYNLTSRCLYCSISRSKSKPSSSRKLYGKKLTLLNDTVDNKKINNQSNLLLRIQKSINNVLFQERYYNILKSKISNLGLNIVKHHENWKKIAQYMHDDLNNIGEYIKKGLNEEGTENIQFNFKEKEMTFIESKLNQLNENLNNTDILINEIEKYKTKYESELKQIESEILSDIQKLKETEGENPNNKDEERDKIKSKIDSLINQLNENMEKEEERIKSFWNEKLKKDSESIMNEMSSFCNEMSNISDQLNYESKRKIYEMELYYYFAKEWIENAFQN